MKIKLLLFLLISSLTSFAQETGGVEMATDFRASGKIYVVIAVALIILVGIFVYLLLLDKKVSKLEKKLNQ